MTGNITCLKWKDKRDVTMISTRPDTGLVDIKRKTRAAEQGTEMVKKPKLVHEYNTHMGGVDISDQLVRYYGYPHRLHNNNIIINNHNNFNLHRSIKWWKRLFYHLLDLSIVNANILYNEVSIKQMTQLDFRVAIISSLLKNHTPHVLQRYYTPN